MIAADFLTKAEAAVASARREFAAGDLEGAANRLYYAMFHAARAALLTVGRPARGRHATIINQFGIHLCKSGPLPAELGRVINEAQELRTEGDYTAAKLDAAEVSEYVLKADEFVTSIKGFMARVP